MTQSGEIGGWESWEWDETLYAGAASHYVRGRVPYAPALAAVLAEALALDGHGQLLDAGCGPGVIALRLAHLFEHVIGLDPDEGMLAEAARLAAARGVTNATWVQHRAEDLPAGLGRFRMVAFAASFHWMDRPIVARAVRSMIEPQGAVVQIDAPAGRGVRPNRALPNPSPPDAEIDALRLRYLGPDRRAGRGIRNTSADGEDDVFRAAGFAPAQTVIVPDGRTLERSADDVVAGVLSMSYTAPHLFGERIDAFEADLRALLAAASPTGSFSVYLPDNLLNIWRVAG